MFTIEKKPFFYNLEVYTNVVRISEKLKILQIMKAGVQTRSI